MSATTTYNCILVEGAPESDVLEGTISGTPKPGTLMSMTSAEPTGDGRMTYGVWTGSANGEQDEVIVLMEDRYQGKTKDDAYANGDHGFMYIPEAGDELLVLLKGATPGNHAIGEKLIIESASGKLIATAGIPEMEPFKLLETITGATSDTLALVRCTGH